VRVYIGFLLVDISVSRMSQLSQAGSLVLKEYFNICMGRAYRVTPRNPTAETGSDHKLTPQQDSL
jgi:hypothetical protein